MNLASPIEAPTAQRSLAGRVAIVTGSTSGIGLGIARSLAAQGAAIVLNGFGPRDEIDRTVRALADETGARVAYHGADISRPAEVADLVTSTEAMLGQVDILVNNAGIQHVAPIEDFPPEIWDRILAINLSGAFHAMRAAIPGMKARGWGRIVNIASAHGLVASPFKSAYVAAKHGIVGLTKVAALELAEAGITVNAVCPGYVWTPLVEQQIDDQARSHGIPREQVVRDVLLKKQPNKRFATVEEMGGTVAFLCSAAAASITGAAITVDGGWTAE
ncbi:MAG TPA: 3-hydroxybutyrate dehydrogenase [Paracoccaceae bacterium]|nr:3-hydroxybutyrate dehydrogenase [Paracoccaceae bacterium]